MQKVADGSQQTLTETLEADRAATEAGKGCNPGGQRGGRTIVGRPARRKRQCREQAKSLEQGQTAAQELARISGSRPHRPGGRLSSAEQISATAEELSATIQELSSASRRS